MMSKFDLTKEEELELLLKAQAGDKQALNLFVEKNQGLVQYIARNLSNYNMPNEDLVQEGNVGLLKAIQNFDPSKNARFSTMAVDYIRTPMYRYIRANFRSVKCPGSRHAARLFYTLPKMVTSADQLNDDKIRELSQSLEVSEDEIKTMIPFVFGGDIHLSISPYHDDSDQNGGAVLENLIDSDENEFQTEIINDEQQEIIKKCIHECIAELPITQQEIINARWFNESGDVLPFSSLTDAFQVRHQALSSREVKAFKTLRKLIWVRLAKEHNIFI